MHKLANVSANPGKVQFEGLVHLVRYIRDNKTLGLKYYAYMNAAPVAEIFGDTYHRQVPLPMITNNQEQDSTRDSAQSYVETFGLYVQTKLG